MSRHSAALAHDPTAATAVHRPDDRFIPVRAADLIAALARDADQFGLTSTSLRAVADALDDVILQEATAFQRELDDAYTIVNPDCETHAVRPLADQRTPAAYARLERQLVYLLEKANFRPLTDLQVAAALRTAATYGLRVRLHPERVERLAVWVRGRGSTSLLRRTARHPWRGEPCAVRVFRRLAVVARLRGDPHVLVKLFKDIPERDVEALLPHAEVSMSWRDRLFVFGGGAGALGSSAKVVGALLGVAVLGKLIWIVLVGCTTVFVRTALGLRRAHSSRDFQRTRHLYFQNLGNNASAIHALIATVAQEELKEVLLAFVFGHASPPPRTAQELAERVSAYVRQRFGLAVDFDAADALESLDRLNLRTAPDALQACDPATALERLRAHWQARRSEAYHRTQAECAPAAPVV